MTDTLTPNLPDASADYDSVEPAPDLEIEIKAAKAAEAVRPQLLPTITQEALQNA